MRKYFIISLSLICIRSFSQTAEDTTNRILAHAAYLEKGSIIIRWVPNNSAIWLLGNYNGYTLERMKIDSTGKELFPWVQVGDSIIRPYSKDRWEAGLKQHPGDTMSGIAMQTIFYDPVNYQSLTLIQQHDYLQNLMAGCLIASDLSLNAALYSGLGYIDRDIEDGNIYVYRITSLIPRATYDISPGITYVNTQQLKQFPKVELDHIYEGDHLIELFWSKTLYKKDYTAYNIYRSEDGKIWIKANYAPVNSISLKNNNLYCFRDSVSSNYKEYQYRIEGLTSFGTKGPHSENIVAMARDRVPPGTPYNIQSMYHGNNKATISWQLDDTQKDLKGIYISKSYKPDKDHISLTPAPLSPDTRSFTDTTYNSLINNFYHIGVVDKEGNISMSGAHLVQNMDSIPPDIPENLAGRIDKNGVVTLSWDPSRAPDTKGYYIYFANADYHEYIKINGRPVAENTWRDTITLKTLTEDIYYKITAVDHIGNVSSYTTTLKLKKPDLIRPTAPLFYNNTNTPKGVDLEWKEISSPDLAYIVLLRKEEKGAYKEVYRAAKGGRMQFHDTNVTPGVKYIYSLYAIDDEGNHSDTLSHIQVRAFVKEVLDKAINLNYRIDKEKNIVSLGWEPISERNTNYIIYRSVNNGKYTKVATLKDANAYSDKLSGTATIKYKICYVRENGLKSGFSNETVIN